MTWALASRARKHSHLDYDRRTLPAGANEGLIVARKLPVAGCEADCPRSRPSA